MSMSEDNSVDKFHIITIRLIRSFHHRNLKNIIIRDVSKNMSVKDFKALINEEFKKPGLNIPPPFRTFHYDTLKIEHVPFKSKSNDPVINCQDDDILILDDEKSLTDYHIVNETEISYFCLADYLEYKSNKIITLT